MDEKTVPFEEIGYKGDNYTIHKCAYCGQDFKHYASEIWYKQDGEIFCSYNCRSKYKKNKYYFSSKKAIIQKIKRAKTWNELNNYLLNTSKNLSYYKNREGKQVKSNASGAVEETNFNKWEVI